MVLLAGRVVLGFNIAENAVVEEFLAEEVEEISRGLAGDVWLEVQEIEIGLVIDGFARGGGEVAGEVAFNRGRDVRERKGVCWVGEGLGSGGRWGTVGGLRRR